MGLWPTRGNENQWRHPREGGGPFFSPMDSRFRGNDVAFGGVAGDEESRSVLKILRATFLAEFTLSTQSEILRFAQDDSEGLGMTVRSRFSHRFSSGVSC